MRRLIWIGIITFAASTAFAQSLAEVAKKEKERREKLDAEESRTITDVELRRVGGPRVPSAPTSSSSAGESADETEAEDSDEAQETDARQNEQYWRGRLEPIDARIQSLQDQLASPQFTMNPVGGPDRQRLEQRLADARAERQALLDEARRAGAPPGWLR